MRSISKNNSGIALLMVISALVILTMITVEFAYNAQIEYHVAVRQKQRLQAYYLANSAYNLTQLQFKLNAPIQNEVKKGVERLANAGIELPFDTSAHICKQFPMQTAIFRLAMAGGLSAPSGEEGEEGGAEGLLAGLSLQGVEDFMKFDGDFESECQDESSKLNLNYFYDQDPRKEVMVGTDNAYDDYKKLIMKTMENPSYRKLFEESDITVEEAVRNIADWVDPNNSINIFGRGERGGEDSQYRNVPQGQATTKNGKFSTMLDIYRVAGVIDKWWIPVSENFTIYGTTSKEGKGQINVCQARDVVVRALVLRYIDTRKDLPPLPPENGEEIIEQLMATVTEECLEAKPDKNKIAKNLDAKISELMKAEAPVENPPAKGAGGAGGQPKTAPFADWITTESRFYSLQFRGQMQDTMVRIDSVIDVGKDGGKDPKQWKIFYWKVY